MSDTSWVNVVTYSDKATAEAILGVLTGEGVPAFIKSDEHVPGLGTNFSLFVPSDRLRQAQRLLERGTLSEKELTDLATGSKLDD